MTRGYFPAIYKLQYYIYKSNIVIHMLKMMWQQLKECKVKNSAVHILTLDQKE